MAAMNFPDNPAINQEYTNDVGRTWVWTGSTWTSKTLNFNTYLADTIDVHGISNTAQLAYLSDLSGKQNVVANVSDTEIGYLANVTSDIQGQLNNKASSSHTHVIGDISNASVTVEELNYLDGVTSNVQAQIDGKANSSHSHLITDISNVTASTSELNILDGATITTTELNYLDGATSNVQAQIDGKANSSHTHAISDISNVTASADEINILDNATISTTELNYLDGVTSNVQAQIDGKANSSHTHAISDIANVSVSEVELNVLDGVLISTTELNYLDGVTSNVQSQLDGKANSSHSHALSDISNVTASANELNILDGVTVTSTEINYLANVSSNIQTQINAKADLSGATFTGYVTLPGDPTQANHAANKAYVDNLAAGLHVHEAAHVATTDTLANLCSANVTYNNGTDGVGATLSLGAALSSIDNHSLTNTDRILVKNESNAAHNGIYVRTSSTLLTRADDFNSNVEIAGGDFVFVENGDTYNSTGWVVENEVNTVGTDAITWAQFAGSGTVQAGNNITVNGYQVSVVSNPSFANLTVTSSADFSNATVSGISLDSLSDVILSNNVTGDVVYYDGTNWVNRYINKIPAKMAAPTITSNNYNLTSGDEGMILEFGSNTATTVTIPTSEAFANGTQMIILQTGTGQVSVIAQNTAVQTFNYSPGNILRSQWSAATLLKRSANNWVMYGDLIA